MIELQGDQKIFVGFKLETGLRRQIEAIVGPDKKGNYESGQWVTHQTKANRIKRVREIEETEIILTVEGGGWDQRLPAMMYYK